MSNIVVKIDTIPGEAQVADHADEIQCLTMRHAIVQPSVSAAVRVEGTSKHGPIELTHVVDKASPLLREAATMGSNLGTVVISRMSTIGGQPKAVETITLSNAYAVRVDVDTPLNPTSNELVDEPLETFALEYEDITWEHKQFVGQMEQGQTSGTWSTLSA